MRRARARDLFFFPLAGLLTSSACCGQRLPALSSSMNRLQTMSHARSSSRFPPPPPGGDMPPGPPPPAGIPSGVVAVNNPPAETFSIDREKTCPFLIRLFYNVGPHRREDEYLPRALPRNELQIYTWFDATLREITELVKQVRAVLRPATLRAEPTRCPAPHPGPVVGPGRRPCLHRPCYPKEQRPGDDEGPRGGPRLQTGHGRLADAP